MPEMFNDVAAERRELLRLLFLWERAVSTETGRTIGRRWSKMKQPMRVALCSDCGACPEVVLDIAKDEVRIGEEGNLVQLTKEAWNTLVEKIKAGTLNPLD
jgi:hypothetical protein